MTTKIIFVRHGEAEGNYERIFHGITNSELTEKGKKQAEKVAQRLKNENIDIIYSSSLKRAFDTAKYIAGAKNIDNIIVKDELVEINGGDWENVEWAELSNIWPEDYENWENHPHLHCMPGGESMNQAYDRIVSAVCKIAEENKGRDICIVTHGTVLRALMCYLYNKPLEDMITISWCDNTAITIVEFVDNSIRVLLEGDNKHLIEGLSTLETQDWWKK